MGFFKEFKEFALRGNVMDLAVGVIMGASFQRIVNSMVTDVLTPPIGYLVGGIKFTDIRITLPHVPLVGSDSSPATINIGNFLQASFDFAIAALCIFMLVKFINNLRTKKEEKAPPEPPADVKLLTEIRDLLKSKE